MMFDLLMAATLAEASVNAVQIASIDAPESAVEEVLVEAPRTVRRWTMPKLDYGAVEQCTSWWESELPGFGTVSFGPQCPDRGSDASFR